MYLIRIEIIDKKFALISTIEIKNALELMMGGTYLKCIDTQEKKLISEIEKYLHSCTLCLQLTLKIFFKLPL